MFFFLMIRRPPRSTQGVSSAASDVYKRQTNMCPEYQDGMISFDEISLKARAQVELDKVYAELCAFSPATGKYSFDSMKKKSFDPAIYVGTGGNICLLYTSPSPRDLSTSRMPSSA
eukprot:TRINITY_DN29503_c0_g1_i1.p2 TRINITY_DN29503_c0_g1~~TRINITY_DN29503_c0_g1_i1.p2  ORF type:complete len:116 (-),score=34.18 TRINITY_DN29503_c0_g1_i1:87-434(-)